MSHRISAAVVCALFMFAVSLHAQDSRPTSQPAKASNNPVVVITTSMGVVEAELFQKSAPKTVANFIGLANGTKKSTNRTTGVSANKKFFDGLQFHRCIKGFMIQGGCPMANGMGDPGFRFEDEFNFDSLGFNKALLLKNEREQHPWARPGEAQKMFNKICQEMGIKSQAEYEKQKDVVMGKLSKVTMKDLLMALGYKHNPKLPVSHKPVRGTLAMANSGPNTNGSQFFINVGDSSFLSGRHTVFGKVTKGMDIVDKISKTPTAAGDKPLTPVYIKSVRVKGGKMPAKAASKPTSKPTSR